MTTIVSKTSVRASSMLRSKRPSTSSCSTIVEMASANPAGSAKRSTLRVKSRSDLGGTPIEMNTAGMPSVSSDITEPCLGRNGKSRPSMLVARIRRKA